VQGGGLYYKTLWIRKLQKIYRFRSKRLLFLVTNITYYGIRALRKQWRFYNTGQWNIKNLNGLAYWHKFLYKIGFRLCPCLPFSIIERIVVYSVR